jgi:hypothetical protein
MAKMYGGRSRYLVRTELTSVMKVLGYSLLLIALWFFVFIKYYTFFISAVGLTGVAVSGFLIIWFVSSRIKKNERRADNFEQGWLAEEVIAEELAKLPDEFVVFQDIDIGRGNIDFAVVGSTGVFAIEVKSMRGTIAFNGRTLTRNGYAVERDMLGQSRIEASFLQKILREAGKEFTVIPILVFANYARMKLGLRPVEGVIVVQTGFLNKAIQERPTVLTTEQIGALGKIIEPKCNQHELKAGN